MESRTLSPEDPNWESRWLPGFTKPLADARERLAKAKEEVAEARADLKDAQAHLDDVDTRLSALQSGPLYRRAQAMLDHVGQDKRFMDILDDMAPGKATGGGLGKLESVINKDIYGKVLEKAVTTALPPLGIANLFRSAIKAEDCERRLDSASKHMGDAPLAKGLATSLAHAKEAEKWKLGIEGTIGFVGMALTMKGASAVGTLMQPAMLVVNKAVEHGTQPLGWIVGGAVSKITESVVEGLPDMVFEKAGTTVLDKASDSNAQGMERAELVRTLKAMEVPEGTSMPVIPVKPYGSSHSAERVLPLSDPQVGIAFLAYLGPKADEGMLRDPGKREMEERRLQLREEMFGAGRSEDLRPGTKVDGDKDLVSSSIGAPGSRTAARSVVRARCTCCMRALAGRPERSRPAGLLAADLAQGAEPQAGRSRSIRRPARSSQNAIAMLTRFQAMPLRNAALVGAGEVVDLARQPAAQRHAEHGCHQHEADPGAGLGGREVVAHDQRVARHDAALRQPEQGRDEIERGQPVEGQVEEQRQALQRRAQEQRGEAADPVGDEARGQPADHAQAQHDRQHLGAARRRRSRGRRNRRRYGPAASTWRCSRRCRPRTRRACSAAGDSGSAACRRRPARRRRVRCRGGRRRSRAPAAAW